MMTTSFLSHEPRRLRPHLKRATVLALLCGVAGFTALIAWQGFGAIAQTFSVAGWRVLWLAAFYLLSLAFAAQAWRYLFLRRERPSFALGCHATWIGLAVNWLLPVAQIGGEVAKARILMKRGSSGSVATASVTVDKTIQALTQLLFTLAGLGLFVAQQRNARVVISALVVIVLFGLGIFGFYRVQQRGLFALLVTLFNRLIPGVASASSNAQARKIDAAVRLVYERRSRFAAACLLRLLSRFLIVGEVMLALHFLGHPIGLIEALILESLSDAMRDGAFIVPGGLGVQEGGLVLVGAMVGIRPDLALVLSLSRRVRELVLGIPGLIAWQVVEGRTLLHRPETPDADEYLSEAQPAE